ncbi:MAG TPA: NUDIX domain-containing protein [Candidatus Saccharimonas sp.]|nr:NUDIX domain-containing protein [Candidatus Saccharimonas sp.]
MSSPAPIVKTRAAVAVIYDGRVLLVHRHKAGREYYVLPGGKVEAGETPEQAAVRELREETTLAVELGQSIMDVTEDGPLGRERNVYFLAASFTGQPRFGDAAPESARQSPDNSYQLEWVPLADLPRLPLVPESIKAALSPS